MNGFREFAFQNKEDAPDKFISTIKKQLQVPKKIWLGMPLLLSNVKLGNHLIGDPTMFYVSDVDAHSVTLTNVPKPGATDEEEDDPDDEIDLDKETVKGRIEVTISRDDFNKLQEPQIPPGADTSMLNIGGGM